MRLIQADVTYQEPGHSNVILHESQEIEGHVCVRAKGPSKRSIMSDEGRYSTGVLYGTGGTARAVPVLVAV